MTTNGTKPAGKSANAYAGMKDMLSGGFDNSLMSDEADLMVDLDQIEVKLQVRGEFEDPENTLDDLGESLKQRQLQAILIRYNAPGRDKPYLLVAGERRMRAAWLKDMKQLRARLTSMTDEEAEDAQLQENIHRKNLTQLEEAAKIQRDLNAAGGDVEAVLAKHKKVAPGSRKSSRCWTCPTRRSGW